MLTVTNYNQQTPTFKTKEKMLKVNPFLQKYGSKMVYASAGSAGVAGSAILASPEAISDPAAAKWFLGGAMVLIASLMGRNKLKQEPKREYHIKSEFGDFNLTKKGARQYRRIVTRYKKEKTESDHLGALANGCYHGRTLTHYGWRCLEHSKKICSKYLSNLELLKALGQLP